MITHYHKSSAYLFFEISTREFTNSHSFSSEFGMPFPLLTFLCKGHATFCFQNGKSILLTPEEALFIPPQVPYSSFWLGNPSIEQISLRFDQTAFNSAYYEPQKLKSAILAENLRNLSTADNTRKFSNNIMFLRIAEELEQTLERSMENIDTSILPAKNYIDNNMSYPVTVEQLAHICNMSKSSFFQKFKAATGYSPIDYKNLLRSKKAITLLVYDQLSLEEITQRLGFSSISHTKSCLKKFTGRTPTEIKMHYFDM